MGNMWSAIPLALPCMLLIEGDGKQGSGPKGDDVLYTEGLSFICLSVRQWDLSLKTEI